MSSPTRFVALDEHCAVQLHHTPRVPEDGGEYPLPPSLGAMELHPAEDGVFVVPMNRAEALWLKFSAPCWRPPALKVGGGTVDAISGAPFEPNGLGGEPQDHVVIPDQPWLDGINAGDGFVRQFVAVPLDEGLTVESHSPPTRSRPDHAGALRAQARPIPHRGSRSRPFRHRGHGLRRTGAGDRSRRPTSSGDLRGRARSRHLGAAASRGGTPRTLRRAGLRGPHGHRHPASGRRRDLHTSRLPWFDLLDPTKRDLECAERLRHVRTVGDLEGRVDVSPPIPTDQVVRLLRLGARG